METSQTSQEEETIKDPQASGQEQQEEENVQESVSGSKPPEGKGSPVKPGRKRSKKDADKGQTETESTTNPKKTKLSTEGTGEDAGQSDAQEQSTGDTKDTTQTDPQVGSASNESENVATEGGGEVEGENSGGKVEGEAGDDESPEDLSMAEGKRIAMEQRQDESEQAKRLE